MLKARTTSCSEHKMHFIRWLQPLIGPMHIAQSIKLILAWRRIPLVVLKISLTLQPDPPAERVQCTTFDCQRWPSQKFQQKKKKNKSYPTLSFVWNRHVIGQTCTWHVYFTTDWPTYEYIWIQVYLRLIATMLASCGWRYFGLRQLAKLLRTCSEPKVPPISIW